ncbi:hypothetical protein LINGRAHAP2_LOCUS4173 [Linum grandiflorum]
MREEDDMVDEEEDDPLCPQICFTAEEKARFQRPWRSALVVKGLDRKIPYIPLARRLNYLWAKHGHIQISDYKIEGATYLIVYEGFHKICMRCGMYGAPSHLCQCQAPTDVDPMISESEEPQHVRDPSHGKAFGEWMMPKRKAWRRPMSAPNAQTGHTSKTKQDNRFDVLAGEDAEVETTVQADTMIPKDTIKETFIMDPTTNHMEPPPQGIGVATGGTPSFVNQRKEATTTGIRNPLPPANAQQLAKDSKVGAKHNTDRQKGKLTSSQGVYDQSDAGVLQSMSAPKKSAKGSLKLQTQSNLRKGNAATEGARNLSPPRIR